jgi:hypothetical protein
MPTPVPGRGYVMVMPDGQPVNAPAAQAQPGGAPMGVPASPGPNTNIPVTPQESTPGNVVGQPAAQTWHGHKYPVLPLAPPGGFPIAPTGPGYYTLLEMIQGQPAEKPPRFPYSKISPIPLPFFDTNFTYLDSIPLEERDWSERLKRRQLGEHWLFSTGGEVRERYDELRNALLSGKNASNSATRVRVYGDLWYEDVFRLYVEGYESYVSATRVPVQARDLGTVDFLNLFIDSKLFSINDNPVYARLGRQELVYGSQRLISTNDFANNLPRFDMAKVFYRSSSLDVDFFTGRPVIPQDWELGIEDHNRWFTGVWGTYKPKPGTFLDAYYLNMYNSTPGTIAGERKVAGVADINTLGSRFTGRAASGFLWDFEGAEQLGHWSNQSIVAGMLDAYVGWNFKNMAWNPTVWLGYDFASGGSNTGGVRGTFNQLFNFGHYYSALIDIFGRQNIQDLNMQVYAYPTRWWLMGLQAHVLRLANDRDALYNYAGVVERIDKTGRAGGNVGTCLAPISNFHLTDRQDIFITYTHFFKGSYIDRTVGAHQAADALFVQYSWRW